MLVNNKKNFVYKEDIFYKKYYTLSELLDVQNSINSTIEKYKKNNLNDEIIKHLNNENSKKTESYFPEIKKSKQGLYLISHGNEFLKIGVTSDIKRRLKEIRFANPNHINVLFFIENVYLLEKILHLRFDNYRINNEWFHYNESILEIFKTIKQNKDVFLKIECKDILKDKLDKLVEL